MQATCRYSANQVVCLIGKDGTIVSEMRKASGASIRIIGTDHFPECASEKDQVVLSGKHVKDAPRAQIPARPHMSAT